MKFTARSVDNLKPQSKRFVLYEDSAYGNGSLGLRVTPNGTKTWIHLYKLDRKRRMTTLGRYPAMTLAQAHEAFAAAARQVAEGGDPGAGVVSENERRRRVPRVTDLAELYIEKWAKVRKKSWKRDQRMLEREVLPKLGHLRVEDVQRRDIIALLDDMVERGAPTQANRLLALVRKMFNFAESRELVQYSPCHRVSAPSPENPRHRMLHVGELRTLLAMIPAAEMWTPTQLALLLLLTTAQRPGEVVGAQWAEIDVEESVWTIPSERAKNKLPHRVPLSAQALAILDLAKAHDSGGGAVFASRRGGGTMVHSLLSRAVARNRDNFGVEHFTPHDLRRTAASHMTAAEVPRLVVSKILNHKESGVTATYDRHSYDREKRDALELWGRQLDSLGLDVALESLRETVQWRTASRWWMGRSPPPATVPESRATHAEQGPRAR